MHRTGHIGRAAIFPALAGDKLQQPLPCPHAQSVIGQVHGRQRRVKDFGDGPIIVEARDPDLARTAMRDHLTTRFDALRLELDPANEGWDTEVFDIDVG